MIFSNELHVGAGVAHSKDMQSYKAVQATCQPIPLLQVMPQNSVVLPTKHESLYNHSSVMCLYNTSSSGVSLMQPKYKLLQDTAML